MVSPDFDSVLLPSSGTPGLATMDSAQIFIVTVPPDSHVFKAVVDLADQNASTLGFIPEEALRRAAKRQRILVATSCNDEVLGYVWYSVTQSTGEARVHHLCVGENSRRRGIGRVLIDELKNRTNLLRGIALRCRRDNPACDFYRKVGFVPFDERPGRGKDPSILTCFWFDHGHPDLETEHRTRLAETKLVVVIDANVFFDLQDEQSPSFRQSQALRADWIDEWAALWITDELYNEIDRSHDTDERRRHRSAAQGFPTVQVDEPSFRQACEAINAILPASHRRSDESDRRHLGAAIASKTDFFVTRDTSLLDHAPQIAESYGVEVCSPLEFILELDERQRKTEYQPARLAGSGISIQLISAQDVSGLRTSFLNHGAGETKGAFENILQTVLSDRNRACGYIVRDDASHQALLVLSERDDTAMEIPLFRVLANRLAPTLARRLMAWVISDTTDKGRSLVLLTDPHFPKVVAEAADELGFLSTPQGRAKICVRGLRSLESTVSEVTALRQRIPDLDSVFDAADRMLCEIRSGECTADVLDRTERAFWPLKLDDTRLPSFMVPIQARWATHLFDEELAAQNLFAMDTIIALQCENVYYRAPKPQVVTAPGRVLWYVSFDKGYAGTAQIRACSRLDEVVVGPAKSLFKRYSRLGVYGWNDVLALARNNPNAEVMAFRFSGTELLRKPIRKNEIRQILCAERGVTPQFTTALALSAHEFAHLYTRGCATQRDANHEQGAFTVRQG